MKFTISIDFASKLGFAVWDEKGLIAFDSFNFQDKSFKKQFKDKKFQDAVFEKILFFDNKANELVEKIFSSFEWRKDDEIDVVIELSDFGFKYSIENITRLFTVFCLQLKLFATEHEISKLTVNKIIAVQWRSSFYKNNKETYNWKNYEVNGKKKKKINWKVFAVDWMKQFKKSAWSIQQENTFNNNDIAEAIMIGYTWIRYMNKTHQ